MKRLLSVLVAMLMVVGMFAIVASAEEELPEDAVQLDYAGYIHDSYFVILAGDNMTVGELTALGIGEEKDMNYFAIAVVDEYDTIIEINMTLGRPDGVKTDTVCPENGYIIGLNGGKAGYEVLESAHVGDIIELINIDLDDYRGKEGSVALENAGFIIHDESGSEDDPSEDEPSEDEASEAESSEEESTEPEESSAAEESKEESKEASKEETSSTAPAVSAATSNDSGSDDDSNVGLIVGIIIAVVAVGVIVAVVAAKKKK